MLSFAYKRFDGRVPDPGDPSSSSGQGLDDEDRALLEKVEAGFETVGELYNACKFRAAPLASLRAGLGEALALDGKPQLRSNCPALDRPFCPEPSSCASWTTLRRSWYPSYIYTEDGADSSALVVAKAAIGLIWSKQGRAFLAGRASVKVWPGHRD